MSQQGNRKSDQDAFLASMTFSSVDFGRGCDCGECDLVPTDIRWAIKAHKRQKLQNVPMMRTQDRALVVREESITVWKWTMPLNAEPLIEYGNNHRIVFVAQLPEGSATMSIGKGVLGSSDETASRSKVQWTQGNAYFLRANGGKALGWVHTNPDPNCPTLGHTIIYNIKISLKDEKLRSVVGEGDEGFADAKWVRDMLQIFAGSIDPYGQPDRHDVESVPGHSTVGCDPSGYTLSADESTAVAKIIAALESRS